MQHLLVQIKQSSFADPVLVMDGRKAPDGHGSWKYAFFRLWRAWDRRFFKSQDGDELSFSGVDISRIEISSSRLGAATSVTPADLAKLLSAELDVLLDFAHAGSAVSLAVAARFGTWFFPSQICEPGPEEGHASALMRSMLDGVPAFEVSLLARRFPDSGLDLLSSFHAATGPISLARAQAALDGRKSRSIMRALRLLHRSQCDWTALSPGPKPEASADATPGNLEIARFLLSRTARALWSKAQRKLRREQWVIGIRKKNSDQSTDERQGFASLVPPPDRFYADPFLFEKQGKSYLFFEELPFATKKGIISMVEVAGDGRCSAPRPVLEMDHHVSYPFVFEWRGHIYMLPEARDSGKISLFRAVNFPDCWKLEKHLIEDVWAVDPTLVEHAGRFWLFAGGVEKHGDINSELYLFFAESPSGPWTPHPLNPVVSDVRRARPAGRLFFQDGFLVRPGQDCSVRYGGAVVLNRVVALSETQYQEEPFGKLPNDWLAGNLGSHTFNSSEHFEVIDGRRLIWRQLFVSRR
jgi:hypothetical protein